MMHLPFDDCAFDKTVSVTAIEFIADAKRAVAELFRVTKRGGIVVVATLNSLSPWADRRLEDARHDSVVGLQPGLLPFACRAPRCGARSGVVRTAVHFGKDDPRCRLGEDRTGGARER